MPQAYLTCSNQSQRLPSDYGNQKSAVDEAHRQPQWGRTRRAFTRRVHGQPRPQTYTATPGAQADLRITVTPGPTNRAAGPLTLTITGPRDSGATRTQLVTNLPVTNPFNNFTVGGYLIR